MFGTDIGIDLGTATVLIYVKNKGIVLREPSVVAVDLDTGKILAVGYEAKNMVGRTPGSITSVRPLRDGVIADYTMTEAMLHHFMRRVQRGFSRFFRNRVMICVPSGATDVERRAVLEAAVEVGAKEAYLIEEPMAAAIGANLNVEEPRGKMVVDIGGGTTDIAVFNEGAIRHTAVLALGGDHITNDIAVGIRTPITEAERLKIKYGHAIAARVSTDEQIEVPSIGGDTINTVPRRILAEIIESRVEELFKLAYTEIRNTGLAETMSAGLVLTGGASSLEGVAQLAESIMHMPVRVGYPRGVKGLVELVNSPAYATAVGLCIYGAGRPSNGYKAKKGSPMYERLLDRLIRWFKEVF